MTMFYERLMAGEDVAFEEVLREVREVCYWMDAGGALLLRRVTKRWRAWASGERTNEHVEEMAKAFLQLAAQAEAGGDWLRAWVFDQCFSWACAVMRGERYRVLALPEVLAGLVVRE